MVDGERTPGIELVERLIERGEDHDGLKLTKETAEQAIEALEHLEMPWLVGEIIESGERFAEQVHSLATRGLQEVVQNADDQGAANIRFGFRRRGRGTELLVAHDGNPVELIDVVRMAWPLLSGSREDPEKIGRFGIGLKTLNQLGDRLAVHCPPVPGFQIQDGRVKSTPSVAAIRNFWNPRRRETLFVLRLRHEHFDFDFFKDWLSGWDASSLLFLRHLRDVSLVNLSASKRSVLRCGIDVGKPRKLELDLPTAEQAQQVSIKDVAGSRRWTRYSVRYPRPRHLQATHKKMDDTVRLQLAVPERDTETRIYVGLPLEEPCELPYSVSAPFEPNVERTRLRDNNKLNQWLIGRLGDFATAVSLRRFADQPKSGWRSVPLEAEGAGDSTWTSAQFDHMAQRQRTRVHQKVRLRLPEGTEIRLSDLTYEPAEFEGLMSVADLERLWDETSSQYGRRRAVPKSWRDRGRWRELLSELEGAEPLTEAECLTILDWADEEIEPRGARWLVELIHASLQAEEGEEVWKHRCIALAGDGGRLSPAEIDSGGTLLVHSLLKEGLAATMGLAQQIARPFRARDPVAEKVRSWLTEKGVLRERASDADALRALAGARREDPIDLSRRDSVLLRLRNSFEHLPAEERAAIGRGVGRNIALSGYIYQSGKKKSGPVRPSDAYLPSAIDKTSGWATAAGQTPEIRWVDTRYRTALVGARGQGALAFLRALGAVTAPRLEEGSRPTDDPNAIPLYLRNLCAQHADELSEYKKATGLRDDWLSRDLESVVDNLIQEKRTTVRRRRARALFLALDRAWDDHYAERSTATAVHHYYTWYKDGEVSATWLARLASEPWLSTRERRFRAAPPRELTVLTEAAFEIEGEHPEKYVYEIDAEQVDSPVVAALQIQGRPFAGGIVERLEAMRRAETQGEQIEQPWADHCYQALASYAPGGAYEDRSDRTPRQLQHAFSDRRGGGGLIRVDGAWLPPRKVRRDPFLDQSLPRVTRNAERLWDLLGVKPPDVADCVSVMEALAEREETNPSSEILTLRHLLSLNSERQLQKSAVRAMPLKTYSGWKHDRRQTIYAVANPALAAALGERWLVWHAPLTLAELAPLIPLLGVELLDEAQFEPEIPSHLAADSSDLQTDFADGIGHLQDYLAVHHPGLHDRIPMAQWRDLRKALVIVGSGWTIRVRGSRRRTVRLQTRAHLFRDPLRLCVLHEDEMAAYDSGGQAIASFFVGDDPAPEDRSTLALAWAYAFDARGEDRQEIDLSAPDEPEDAPAPSPDAFERFSRQSRRKRITLRTKGKAPPEQAPPRELVDLDELRLSAVNATFLEGKRRGKLKASPGAKVSDPSKTRERGGTGRRPRAGQRHYTDRDREDVAWTLVDAMLSASHGLVLEDIRDQPTTGADAVDRDQDIWVELKAHGQDAGDSLRLEPAEAQRAEEKRGNYWLVVVWNLEKPRTPELVVIPDPLRRLDTYLGRGLKLTGIRELAAHS